MQNCVYCDQSVATTSDHVPPKLLIPDPYPADLLTVPACGSCNRGFQRDDEYFRQMLVSRVGVDEHPAGRAVLERSLRNLSRAEARRTLDAFIRTTTTVPITTPAGLHVGRAPAYNVEMERVSNAIGHIVRGLYWHHTRLTLPSRIGIRAFADFQSDVPFVHSLVSSLAGTTLETASGVLQYRWIETQSQPFFTVWLFSFYETAEFAAVSIDPSYQRPSISSPDA